jgi:hypothetical protein
MVFTSDAVVWWYGTYQSETIRGTNYYEGPIFLYILFLCTFSFNSTCSALGRNVTYDSRAPKKIL